MSREYPQWLQALSEEDLHFMREFVLASGSLKELAKRYGISYPTVRVRLDRLIKLVEDASEKSPPTPLERELQQMTVRGEISSSMARQLLAAHQKTLEEQSKA